LWPVVGISRIRRWKRVEIDSAMALDQVVAVLLSESGKAVVEIDGWSQSRIALEIPAMLLAGRALRCYLVVHRFGVDHRICRVLARKCSEFLSLKLCVEKSPVLRAGGMM
jgi:hypothetical protein